MRRWISRIAVIAAVVLLLGWASFRLAGSRAGWGRGADGAVVRTERPSDGVADAGPKDPQAPRGALASAWRRAGLAAGADPGREGTEEGVGRGEGGEGGSSAGGSGVEWIGQMFAEDGPRPVSEEVARRWVESGHTNAADLLALRQVGGGGRELVERVLAEFPNDPRGILESLAYDATPEVRRERLERFRATEPDNALPDYLAALNELKSGHPARALEMLGSAAEKGAFRDYTLEAARAAEQVYLADGRSAAEAKALGSSSVHLPHLSQLSELSRQLVELQGQALAAGDTALATQLAQHGVELGRHLTQGGGSVTLLGEMVGMAVEKRLLAQLPAEATYEFLGGTPAERLESLEARTREVKGFGASFETWVKQAPEAEVSEYFARLQRDGEREALRWMKEQATPAP